MPELFNQTQGRKMLTDLKIASNMFGRMKGLLGTESLSDQEALWIHSCNSIHTFFMNYAIDCIFLNDSMQVITIVEGVRPGRIVWPQWGARSVIEMKSGSIRRLGVQVGDQLNVGAARS